MTARRARLHPDAVGTTLVPAKGPWGRRLHRLILLYKYHSLREAARGLGVHERTLYRWRRGESTPSPILQKLYARELRENSPRYSGQASRRPGRRHKAATHRKACR